MKEEYLIHFAQLTELVKCGEGDQPQADQLRDEMDNLWYSMTDDEREEVKQELR